MLSNFQYLKNNLHAESVNLHELADAQGTPLFVYSLSALKAQYTRYQKAFGAIPHLICYAVKANSNLAILNSMANMGSGFDVVSGGELRRVLKAGGDPAKIVFSGVAKSVEEMELGLEVNINCFNIESVGELEQLADIATHNGVQARISIRVNPNIKAGSHAHVQTGTAKSKFGIALSEAEALYLHASTFPSLVMHGIDCHIGSQIYEFTPITEMLQHMLSLIDRLATRGIHLKHVDIGGGLGLKHTKNNPFGECDIEGYANAILPHCKGREIQLVLEPGRALIGLAGLLLTRVRYLKPTKEQHFAIVDAGMSHFIRPALYHAAHPVIEVKNHKHKPQKYDVVGPVCESADVLAHQQELRIAEGDILAICMAGAYGATMSSNYNTLPRAAEVMVDQQNVHLIRERENIKDMWHNEHIPQQ